MSEADRRAFEAAGWGKDRGETIEFMATPTEDAMLLSRAISVSKKSVRGFQRDIIPQRTIRSVWRWIAGTNSLPADVRATCEAILATSDK